MLRQRTAVAILLGALAAFVQGCSSDEPDEVAPPSADETTLSDCERLVPDSVVETLGWSDAGEVELKAGRCTRTGADGMVQLHRVPFVYTDEEDLADKAQEAYDARCSELDPEPGEPVDWLGDQQACATVPGDADYAYLVTLTADDALVEAFVAPNKETPDDQVVQGLTELAEGYES